MARVSAGAVETGELGEAGAPGVLSAGKPPTTLSSDRSLQAVKERNVNIRNSKTIVLISFTSFTSFIFFFSFTSIIIMLWLAKIQKIIVTKKQF
jgi:hypothetical protein